MGIRSRIKPLLKYILKGVPIINIEAKIYQLQSGSSLLDRNIIITGGSRGLGFSIAKKCIEEGATVLITGRNISELKKAKNKLGAKCKIFECDIKDTSKIDFFINKATELFNGEKIDSLVSNAGISLHERDYSQVTITGWDSQFDTNLKGAYFLIQAFVNQLMECENTSGNVLIISSERGLYCDDVPYGLTKAAINSFTHGLSRRLLDKGIRVNAIAPGVTASEMTGYNPNGNLYREYASGKRIFLPEEVAEVASFLLSDASKCISGEIIACDQGNYLKCDW